ncbi:MAG: ATP-dependent helicase NAM7 [Peltula sp. TS41687]|nr:MAG: ATP-dependent helicase NAM7 [Peltula sp. TS41687]
MELDVLSVSETNASVRDSKAFYMATIVIPKAEDQADRVFGQLAPSEDTITFKVIFDSSDDYHSYLRINGTNTRKAQDDDENQSTSYKFAIKFGARCIEAEVKATHLTSRDDVPESIRNLPGFQDTMDQGKLHRLTYTYCPGTLVTEMFHLEDKAIKNADLKKDLKSHLLTPTSDDGKSTLVIYFKGDPDAVTQELDALNTRFAAELKKDPIDYWHINHPTKHFVQRGDTTPAGERPRGRHRPQNVFSDFGEYQTVIGYSAIIEDEYVQEGITELKNEEVQMRLMDIPRADGRRYYAFIRMEGNRVRVQPGDRITVDVGDDDDDDTWTAHVVDGIPITPFGDITAILKRPYTFDAETKTRVYSNIELSPIASPRHKTLQKARSTLSATPSIPTRIAVPYSDKTIRVQIDALRTLDQLNTPYGSRVRRLLTGELVEPEDSVDLYQVAQDQDKMDADITAINFNKSQRKAVEYLRHLPNGLGIISGPPGTGKSWFITRSIVPLLRYPRSAEQKRQVLILAPGNDQVTGLSKMMDEALVEASLTKTVIRLHSWTTEEELVQRQGKTAKGPIKVTSILDTDTDEEEQILAEFEVVKFLTSHYIDFEKRNEDPNRIKDPRVKAIELSLGTHLMREAGITPGATKTDKWAVLRQQYDSYVDGSLEQKGEEWTAFRDNLRSLRNAVFSKADVIVTTCTNAAEQSLYTHFDPDIIYIDEAARTTELDVMSTGVKDGDEHLVNPFAMQLTRSPFRRLKSLGHPSVMFREQHRMVPGLAAGPSKIFYEGRLINTLSTSMNNRPIANQVTHWLKSNGWGKAKQPRVLHLALVESLTKHGVSPADVVILSPYKAQYNRYREALTVMERDTPDAGYDKLRVRVIDGFQGDEAPVVFLDLTISERLGFVGDKRRLNVALTRAQDGLVLVADAGAINNLSNTRKDAKYLVQLLRNYRQSQHSFRVGKESSMRQSRFVSNAEDVSMIDAPAPDIPIPDIPMTDALPTTDTSATNPAVEDWLQTQLPNTGGNQEVGDDWGGGNQGAMDDWDDGNQGGGGSGGGDDQGAGIWDSA